MILLTYDIGIILITFTQWAAIATNIIISIYFIYKIFKHERKWMNYNFLVLLILNGTALSLNLVLNIISFFFEEVMSNSTLVHSYYFIIYLYLLSPIFTVTFCLSFTNSLRARDLFSKKIQVTIIIIYFIIISFKFFIPDGITIENDIVILNLPYYIYIMLISIIGVMIPLSYISIGVIIKVFEEKRLKNKWMFVVFGMICSSICLILAITNFMIFIQEIKIILFITVFILQFIGSYLIYVGFIKEFKK